MKVLIGFVIVIFLGGKSFSQTSFTYKEYINWVIQEHPIAKQAQLQINYAQIEQVKAKSVLDPKMLLDFNTKDFSEKEYYQILNADLKIPTQFGFDLKFGFDQANGDYLNPEQYTSNKGLWSAGVEMDILRNLQYNDRKLALDKAKIFQSLSANQKQIVLNNLMYEASLAYIDWYIEFEKIKIVNQAVALAETYVGNTKQAVFLGDKPAIDSVEAQTVLLQQQAYQQNVIWKLAKAKWKVNSFLWENNQMIGLSSSAEPVLPELDIESQPITEDYFVSNPEIIELDLLKHQIEIENKWKKQQLLPSFTLGYFPLAGTTNDSILPQNPDIGDYKLGASLSMSLFRRKEKASLQKGQTKREEIELKQINKQNQLYVKWAISQNEWGNLNRQEKILQQAQSNLDQLVEAEMIRYNFGESSTFLVNKRLENSLKNQINQQEIVQNLLTNQINQKYLLNQFIEK